MMFERVMESGSTIRADTSARHRHKYANQNPIHRLTLGRFFDRVAALLSTMPVSSVLEFGCGEGYFLRELRQRGFAPTDLTGIDLRADAIAEAQALHPQWKFACENLFSWTPTDRPSPPQYDLVIASQVLEHIPDPRPVLRKLLQLTSGRLLLTVPNEPWFQLINFLRGRDVVRFGNHPEHVNRWSKNAFEKFVASEAIVDRIETSFPFTILVARPR